MTFFPELVIETCRHDRSHLHCSIPEGYTKLRSAESNTWRRLFSLPITGRTFATLFPVAELYVRAVCSVSHMWVLKVHCQHRLSLALRSTGGPTGIYMTIILICCIRCGPDEERILDVVPREDGARNSGQDGESGRPHKLSIIPKQNILEFYCARV